MSCCASQRGKGFGPITVLLPGISELASTSKIGYARLVSTQRHVITFKTSDFGSIGRLCTILQNYLIDDIEGM